MPDFKSYSYYRKEIVSTRMSFWKNQKIINFDRHLFRCDDAGCIWVQCDRICGESK